MSPRGGATAAGPTLELADIQGGVLRGYGHPFATYALVRVPDVNAGRALAGTLAATVTTAEPWRLGKPQVTINAALTCSGLEALGVDVSTFPRELREGMAARRARLGDDGASDPASWEDGLRGDASGHVLIWASGKRSDAVRAQVDDLTEGFEVVFRQDTALLPYGREHFGFNDGFAQPSVAGSGQENRPGEGVPRSLHRWRLLRPGEIVLGYEDEDGLLPPAPAAPLHRNATFMVVRKLQQDVFAWRAWLRDTAESWAGGDEEWLAAKVCGRWTDGTPTALEPGRGKRRVVSDLHEINAFRFGDDPRGMRCPVGAHIRRVNPREGLAGGANRTRRHRMIRRGMPYGPPAHGDVPDDVERGLFFACFNASIARQFEVVQSWSVDGNVFGLGVGNRDFLAGGGGDGTQPFTIPGAPPVRVPGPGRPLVTVRGGEYLYVPSLSGLRALASGEAAAT